MAEPEPEPGDGPIGCCAWLHVVSGPMEDGVGRVGVRGFPFAEWIECGACLVWDRRGGRHSGRDESAYLVRQLDAWEAANGGVWVDPDGGLEDDFDDMGVASWDGGAWNPRDPPGVKLGSVHVLSIVL